MQVFLNIEGGIRNIQSQHIGECVYDTFQTLFFYADGFREHFAYYAQDCLKRLAPADIFELTSTFEDDVETIFFKDAPKSKDIQYLKSFIARAVRRYILIQLQNCNWTKHQVETYFKIPEITTQCILPYKPSVPPLKRRGSLNIHAGVTTAEALMKFTSKPTIVKNTQLETQGLDIDNIMAVYRAFFTNDTYFDNHFEIKYLHDPINTNRLVGIHIAADQTNGTGGHSNAIIRYRGKFYVCDDNVGVAMNINNSSIDMPLNGKSFSYNVDSSQYTFLIENKQVLSFTFDRSNSLMKFTSVHAFFIYTKPTYEYIPALLTDDAVCSPPPSPPGVVESFDGIVKKFPGTSAAHCASTALATAVPSLLTFRRTRRISRCFLASSDGGEITTLLKPSATRRARFKCGR